MDRDGAIAVCGVDERARCVLFEGAPGLLVGRLQLRSGYDGPRIAFIFDESNVLESGFLESIKAFLVTGRQS